MVIAMARIVTEMVTTETIEEIAIAAMTATLSIVELLRSRCLAMRESRLAWPLWLALVLLAFFNAGWTFASVSERQSAATLQARYASMAERFNHNQYRRALYLDSTESPDKLKGDLYALIDYPFATVSTTLNGPEEWCEVLILHINTKYCRATTERTGTVLTVGIGKKYPQPPEDAYPIAFTYRLEVATTNYLAIRLDADKGPMSTSDYRIRLTAIPVDGGRTFLHLTYSYAYGWVGRLAMKTYLATIGRNKVGFTITGRQTDGEPEYIGGVRGVVERNTMRYYLAIDSYLGAVAEAPRDRIEKRLRSWFAATEEYPHQLHELDKADYLVMKRSEYARQPQSR